MESPIRILLAALLCLCHLSATSQSALTPRAARLHVYGDTLTLHYYIALDSADLTLPQEFRYPAYVMEGVDFRVASEVITSLGRSVDLADAHISIMEAQRQLHQHEIEQHQHAFELSVSRVQEIQRERDAIHASYQECNRLLKESIKRQWPPRDPYRWVPPAMGGVILGILTGVFLRN